VLGLVERIQEQGYQVCLIDPEGDYEQLGNAVNLGDPRQPPSPGDVLDVLGQPDESVCVSLLAVAGEDRPTYFAELSARLRELRSRTGRPHWLIVDEAHHVLPPSASLKDDPFTWEGGLTLVTLGPLRLTPGVEPLITHVCVVGQDPATTLQEAGELLEERVPAVPGRDLTKGRAFVWRRGAYQAQRVDLTPSKAKRRRHRRKYVEGELPPERSFYFRGPRDALNLRAQNLELFTQVSQGVDDETWVHHLRAGDYSRWIETELKDAKLAKRVAAVEQARSLDPNESRAEIRAAIEERYAPPA
jgi:hypothetical protein